MKMYAVQEHNDDTESPDPLHLFNSPDSAVAMFDKEVERYRRFGATEYEDEYVKPEKDAEGLLYGKAVFGNADGSESTLVVKDITPEDDTPGDR